MAATAHRHPALAIGVVVAGESLLLAGLVALGSQPWAQVDLGDPLGWVRVGDPVELGLALVRLVAVAAAAWLLVGTLAQAGHAALLGSRGRPAPRLLPRALRRRLASLTAGLVSSTLVLPGLTLPALATPLPNVVPAPAPAAADATTDLPVDPTVVGPTVGLPAPPARTPAPTTPVRGATPEDTHVVVAGEHLWSIAGDHLTRALGRPPTAGEHARHWHRLVAVNTTTLRSGDPDLVHPGERLLLPPAP